MDLLLGLAREKEKGSTVLYEQMSQGARLFRQGYLDTRSLYMRNIRRRDIEVTPMEAREADEGAGEQTLQEFIYKAKKSFSHQRVISFMKEVLREKDVVNSGEIVLSGDEEFILLCLLPSRVLIKTFFIGRVF